MSAKPKEWVSFLLRSDDPIRVALEEKADEPGWNRSKVVREALRKYLKVTA